MTRPIQLHKLALVSLALAVVSLLGTNACTVYVAMLWQEQAKLAAENFERCKAWRTPIPAPYPRPGAMIVSDGWVGSD